jgi:hypothetical protein
VAATYITQAELRALLGITGITLYTDATVEEVCQATEDILKKYLWFDQYSASSQKLTSGVCYLYFDNPVGLYVGQTVVISNAGSKYTGSKTIASMPDKYTITYTANGQSTDEPLHAIKPPALVSATTHVDYATTPAVREAAAALATTIWQARQAPGASITTVDGFIASPYQLGNTLIAKVRGLIAPYMSPNSMVG